MGATGRWPSACASKPRNSRAIIDEQAVVSNRLPKVNHRSFRIANRAFAPGNRQIYPRENPFARGAASFQHMRLADRVAQCRTPFIVKSDTNNGLTRLKGAADFANDVLQCPTRYVLDDGLTRLCTALAYSKGARNLACADLLHVPMERVWIEWCEATWQSELQAYGFKLQPGHGRSDRRGALIQSSSNGRCGWIRTFWTTGETDLDVLSSNMEAYFDLDTEEGGEPTPPNESNPTMLGVTDVANGDADILRRCFRFRFEQTWADYYRRAALPPERAAAITRHSLGTIAAEIPVLLAFFLLLSTRNGLPQRTQSLERLNRSRARTGKVPLLDHIEVLCPVLSKYASPSSDGSLSGRARPRLHQVRGHLVRRGSKLFWRVPHLRGNGRSAAVHTRTVTWTIDRPRSRE
jgi:hypothetical protein